MDRIFDNLNENQKEAVKATEGRVRVVAGAGSGKTRVLAHRFAYLVNELGISPSNILCMTFTNKAAQEMRNRIAKMVHQGHVNDFVCTIHGFCVKVLRRDIHRLGYPSNFIIHDDEDAKHFAKQVMEEFGIDYTKNTINKFLSDVSGHKMIGGTYVYIPNIVLPTAKKRDRKEEHHIERYIQLQVNNFALDFNDVIAFALYLFRNYDEVRKYWQERLNYVMVDEVQDCNLSDWELIETISKRHGNLFIVGDPDQAIYEWRGSQPYTFVDFKADTDIILAENYRSTPNVLDVANSIIANNKNRIKKDLYTQKAQGKKAIYYHGKSEEDEATWIAKTICELKKKGANYNDIAILYRASYLSRNIEQALIKKQIKYTVWGGVRFFERREIKDAIAYLRLTANKDDLSFQRVVNVPSRKFGEKSLMVLKELANAEGTNLFQTLVNHKEDKTFNKQPLHDFIALIKDCEQKKDVSTITELFDYILKQSGLWDMYRTEGDEDRLDNLNELISSIKLYESYDVEEEATLEKYLQDVSLFTNADYKDDGNTVKLMTIHQAKGLEFPFVFACGLNEGIFPSLRTIRERKKQGLEEERRLMYVAVTRAEKGLFLTESEGYNFQTRTEKFPSRFLTEIKDGLLKIQGEFDIELFNSTKELVKYMYDEEITDTQTPLYEIGDHIIHSHFGEGIVISRPSDSDNNTGDYVISFGDKVRHIRKDFVIKDVQKAYNKNIEEPVINESVGIDTDKPQAHNIDYVNSSSCIETITETTKNEDLDKKPGLNEDVKLPIEENDKMRLASNNDKQQIEKSDYCGKINNNEGYKDKKKHLAFSTLSILCILFICFTTLSIIWVILSGSILSYIVLGFIIWLALCFIIAMLKKQKE